MTGRRARWAGAIAVGSLTFTAQGGAQVPPGPPAAEPEHAFFLGAQAGEVLFDPSRRTTAQAFGAAADVREGLRLRIQRGEEEVLEATAAYKSELGDNGWSEVTSPEELQTGDRVEYYVPPSAEVATQVVIWDGRPTLESCDVGATTAGGRANPRTDRLYLTVRRAGGSDEGWNVAGQGETWSGTSSNPLATGDLLMMHAHYEHDDFFSVTRSEYRRAGECRPPVVPIPELVVFDGHDGLLDDLDKGDVGQEGATVEVEVGCDAASAIPCTGPVRVDTVGRYATASAKRKRMKLASRKVTVAPGKHRVVRLKVRKSGRKLLDRRRRVAALVTAAAKDPSGASRATSRKLTLKAKR